MIVVRVTLSDHAPSFLALDAITHSLAPCLCHILDSIYVREEGTSHIIGLWSQEGDEPMVS